MDSLKIEKQDTTPLLDFNLDKMEFILEGECRPENGLVFFEPVISWLDVFIDFAGSVELGKKLEFHFKLEYYNSSSAKFIFNIFKRLKSLNSKGIQLSVLWFYDVLDEDLLESGKEYEKILGLKFHFLALQN
ncbi:MAG: hypothetical protein CMP67_07760 [Flavobacteriales bacterium]|nr:hypothetical protein [Flavobacteriales bacterium]MBO72942.1 hypothetical protein [Flavobacteriales bacterium]|tara:strand:+ start:3610 stop:4005 length:396 start_codon:yes stop_codon:yes gene_type:complete